MKGTRGKKKKREQGDVTVLTNIVRIERDQGKGRLQQRIELRRLGMLQSLGDELGEVVAIVQRECKEGRRQKTRGAKVDGHDPAPSVLHEVVAGHVARAEGQAAGLDLGTEADTLARSLAMLQRPQNLCLLQ